MEISTISENIFTASNGAVSTQWFSFKTSVPVVPVTEQASNAFSSTDKIALGVGIGFGIPIVIGIIACVYLLGRYVAVPKPPPPIPPRLPGNQDTSLPVYQK